MPPNENGETRNPAQQPLPHRLRAHNARIWATLVLIRLAPASAHIGGSGATVARQLATIRDLAHRHRTTTTAAQLEGLPPVELDG